MFSKILLATVMLTYFVGVAVGGLIAWRSHEYVREWLAFIGTPVVSVIGWYTWKAKAENIKKIENKLAAMKEGLDSEITYGHDTY